ncbi:MAG: polymerase sigma factor, sigma-70 family [Candidatus Peribacteria bacterium]|nr:polymerase sigma factor, sigma-70 family [Candidatus Peribacteria bacterium]
MSKSSTSTAPTLYEKALAVEARHADDEQLSPEEKQTMRILSGQAYFNGAANNVLHTSTLRSKKDKLEAEQIVRERYLKALKKASSLYVRPHSSFGNPAEEGEVLMSLSKQMDASAPVRKQRIKAPAGLAEYLADLYDSDLLTREEECYHFFLMNLTKFTAKTTGENAPDPESSTTIDLQNYTEKLEMLLAQAEEEKSKLITSNLRLVVSIAKRYTRTEIDFFELISEGNMAVIRAVEKFDFSRGNKFSSYASWVVKNRFAKFIPGEITQRDNFSTRADVVFEFTPNTRSSEKEIEVRVKAVQERVAKMLGTLDERERKILEHRYGLGEHLQMSLQQLGRTIGLSKARVQQIETSAHRKLRKLAPELMD